MNQTIHPTQTETTDEPGVRRFVVDGKVKKNQYGWDECSITVNGIVLDIKNSLKVANHSPGGFTWGYGGSGPAQSALAILQHLFGDEFAQTYHQDFKWAVMSKLPKDKPFHAVVMMREKDGYHEFYYSVAAEPALPVKQWVVEFDDAFESADDATGKPCLEITVAAHDDRNKLFDTPMFEFKGTIIELLAEVEKRKEDIVKTCDHGNTVGHVGVQFSGEQVTQAERDAIENRTTNILVTIV